MRPLMAVMFGALAGLGLFLICAGVLGRPILSGRVGASSRSGLVAAIARNREAALGWSLGALLAAVVAYATTGWPVLSFGVAALVAAVPGRLASRQSSRAYVERTQAVATWIEMVRDNMAGAAGLEQALQASAALAPRPIKPEMQRFSRRVERDSLERALERLGEDLDNPSADLALAALINAARLEARELGPLLGRLAAATRAEVQMRLRVEVGRARIRTSARIVVATTALTVLFLIVFSRQLLSVYDTAIGQLWLVLVSAVFAGGGILLSHYGNLDMPQRFEARRSRPRSAAEGPQSTSSLAGR